VYHADYDKLFIAIGFLTSESIKKSDESFVKKKKVF
jgi:hypothetical protein